MVLSLLGIALLIAFGPPPNATASSHPTLEGATSANGYGSVDVTFSDAAFTTTQTFNTVTSGTGALTAADFSVSGTSAPSISSVTPVGGDSTTWRLTFSGAATPYLHSVNVSAGSIFTTGGTDFGALTQAVPFSSADLQTLLTGFKEIDLPLQSLRDLPFIGDWFLNEPGAGTGGNPRAMTDVIDTISPFTIVSSENALATGLEALLGIADVSFSSSGMTVAFDNTQTSATVSTSGATGIPSLGLSFEDVNVNAALKLDGALTVGITGGNATVNTSSPNEITVGADVNASATMNGRLGFVEVTAPGTISASPSIALDLSCTSGSDCSPNELTAGLTRSGSISATLDSLSITDGDPLPTTFDPASGALLAATWGDLNSLDTITLTQNQFPSFNLDDLHLASMSDVISGLGWLANWLAEAQGHGAMASELPLIGGTLGELSGISSDLAAEVQALIEIVTPATGTPPDPSAQSAVELLCEQDFVDPGVADCEGLLAPFDLVTVAGEVTALEYSIEAATMRTLFAEQPELALALGNDLQGLGLSAHAGTWSGTANADFSFTLGIKIGSDADLLADLNLTTADFDNDGTVNSSDTDADGDGLTDATADTDDDADGFPEHYSFVEGDLCTQLASLLDVSPDDLRTWNATSGQLTLAQCDNLAATGTVVKTSAGGATTVTLTNDQVCTAGAAINGVSPTTFKAANSYATDAACSSAVAAGTGTFSYDVPPAFGAPITLGHRLYVGADSTPLVDIGMDIEGAGVGASATLGFLDVEVASTGDIELDPSIEVDLVDPGTSAADGKIDLIEIANAADSNRLGQLIDIDLDGDIEAHFVATNNVLPSPSLATTHLDVVGDFSALDNPPGNPIFSFQNQRVTGPTASNFVADRINVGHDLGNLLELKDLSAADVIQILADLADRIATFAGADAMATEIPFTGTSVSEMVGFAQSFADIAAAIEARDPQTLSAFEAALSEALAASGMPDSITIGVTAEGLSFTFDADKTIGASYPFSFDLAAYGVDFEGIPGIPLLPADGGASIAATAALDFNPTVGILFDGAALADRIYVSDLAPTLTANVNGSLHGPINLGPLETTIDGALTVDAELGLTFDDPNLDDKLTVRELLTGLSAANIGNFMNVTFEGPYTADLSLSNPPGCLDFNGNLNDPLNPTVTCIGIDFSEIELNLESFVSGSTQLARFIGRLLKKSDAFTTNVPLIGEELKELVTIGQDLQRVADAVDQAWQDAENGQQDFIDELIAEVADAICPPTTPACVDFNWTDEDGNIVDDDTVTGFNDAGGILLEFTLEQEESFTEDLAGGIDLSPVLELDANVDATGKFGYRFNAGLGVSINKGFFVKGGPVLDVYANIGATGIDSNVKIAGFRIGGIENGSATVGGDVGPLNDSAGFRVSLPDAGLNLADLSNRRRNADSIVNPEFDIEADIDLPIETDFGKAPNLRVPVHFNWNVSGSLAGGLTVPKPTLSLGTSAANDQIELDVSSLTQEVLKPLLKEVQKYNPFGHALIRDTLDTEIPVFEATVEDLAEVFAGVPPHPSWKLFKFLVGLQDVIDDLEASADEGDVIKLGWVDVLPTFQKHANSQSWFEQVPGLGVFLDSLVELAGGNGTFQRNPAPAGSPPGAQPTTSGGACPTSTNQNASPPAAGGATSSPRPGSNIGKLGCLFSFPVLDDPMAMVGMILGGDFSETVSFVEFRPPPINVGPAIAWSRTLFDLDIGFLKGSLTVGFDGALGLTIRLGFGYDSSGFQEGRNFIDGFYLVDFKDGRRDLQEVEVGGRVAGFIDGKFSVLGDVAKAEFNGSAGVNMTGGLDINDESVAIPVEDRGDGRFHLRELLHVANSSLDTMGGAGYLVCPFRLTADVSAFLSLRGKAKVLGVTVFNKSWSDEWDILSLAGIDEEERTIACPLGRRPAKLLDSELILNAGPEHSVDRFSGNTSDIAEEFDITKSGSNIVVTGFGKSLSFPAADIDVIRGDLGNGNDSVTVADGIDIPVLLSGGPGNDDLDGGGDDDEIDGGPGNDTLTGGPGADLLLGGAGNDSLTGQGDDDELQGGDGGDDTYHFADGWGDDFVEDPDGRETFDFTTTGNLVGTSSYGEATITDGTSTLGYFTDEIDVINGGTGHDHFTLKSDVPDGFELHGRDGNDTIDAEFIGQGREISITGDGGSDDTFNALGTVGPDLFLLRATTDQLAAENTDGFVAMLAGIQTQVDRVNYDYTFETLDLDTGDGDDTVAMDDNATSTDVHGGAGDDEFFVGQLFHLPRNADAGIDAGDFFHTQDTTRGELSKGISYETDIDGEAGNDTFTVFSNRAVLDLFGGDDDDTFIVRAFVLEGSIDLSGEAGSDSFEYVRNELVNIDGGAGFDTFIIVGTEFRDGFRITSTGIRICKVDLVTGLPSTDDLDCAIDTTYVNIERVVGQGLEADDVFHVISTSTGVETELFGSTHSDRFVVGTAAGDVTGIQGELTVRGETDPSFVDSIPDPIVLPDEDDDGADPPFAQACEVSPCTTTGDSLLVNAAGHSTNDTGVSTLDDVTGLGMGSTGVVYEQLEFATVQLGSGADIFTVESTHATDEPTADEDDIEYVRETTVNGGPGADTVNVETIDGLGFVNGEAGDDTINVGNDDDLLEDIDAVLDIDGGDDFDETYVDDSGEDDAQTATSYQGRLTGIGLFDDGLPDETGDGITYSTIELLDVELGDDSDVVNVRGTSTHTVFHGNSGDERFYVSDDADQTTNPPFTDFLTGHLDDIDGDLDFDAGLGRHLLMVSDEAATAADTGAVLDEDSLTGLSTGDITYEADGNYLNGVTVWTSRGDDELSFEGARLDAGDGVRTVTTLNTNTGVDDVDVDLDEGIDGAGVINLQAGADILDGSGSTAALIVFGSDGADTITTGDGDDYVLGDDGHVLYQVDGGDVTVHGGGGPGDKTDGVERAVAVIESDDAGDDADDDIINANDGDDIVIGGGGTDEIDGGDDDDQITGDSARYTGSDDDFESLWLAVSDGGANDVIAGGLGNDWVMGQHGADELYGGEFPAEAGTEADGNDILIGGHQQAAGLDDGDDIDGDDGADLLLGDNAHARPGTDTQLLDVETTEVAFSIFVLVVASDVDPSSHGPDDILGGAGTDEIFGQGDDDTIDGQGDDDYIEGNHGADTIWGGGGNDDILGGGSATDGIIDGDRIGTYLLDGADTIYGDANADGSTTAEDGHDVVLGDNGRIERTGVLTPDGDDLWTARPVREVSMADVAGDTSGSDLIRGNGGDDDLYGQYDDTDDPATFTAGCVGTETLSVKGDLLCGDDGDDALVGDNGVITTLLAEHPSFGGTDQQVVTASPFLNETIYPANTLVRVVELWVSTAGDGDDVMFGGAHRDWIHGNAGDDWANGGPGDDSMFGDDDSDRMWGGSGHDRMYGGYGVDYLDVKLLPTDTALAWFYVAPPEDRDNVVATNNGNDTIYGGWDQDTLQADTGDAGRVIGDRLMDWSGAYNLYAVCNGPYGAGRVVREYSPTMERALHALAGGDGAVEVTVSGSSGFNELAFVFRADVKDNTKPRHVDWPGNFTCEG